MLTQFLVRQSPSGVRSCIIRVKLNSRGVFTDGTLVMAYFEGCFSSVEDYSGHPGIGRGRCSWPGCNVLWAVALAGKHGAAILSITVPRDPSAGPSDFKGLWAVAEESAAEHGQPDTL